MISGLYSAATAMDAAALRHEVASENLAHVQMPGFRRRMVLQSTFEEALAQANDSTEYSGRLGASSRNDAQERNIVYDFTSGPLKQTGRTLDVALGPDSFFVVDGPEGPLYTRNGSFYANGDGEIVTVDGLPVTGNSGPLRIPGGVSSEQVQVSGDGELLIDNVPFGEFRLVRFDDLSQLQSAGTSLFSAPEDLEVIPADRVVHAGFIEQANFSPVDELVSLIVASRQYEAAQKALSAISETAQQRIGLR